MTEPSPVADDFAVSAFVFPDELARLAPRFRTIINNRCDGEEPGQPTSAQLEAEARRLGLDYVHIPVVPAAFKKEQVDAFGKALRDKKGPILAFCKTGRRAVTLWALSEAGQQSAEEILAAAAAAGHDLTALKPALAAKACDR